MKIDLGDIRAQAGAWICFLITGYVTGIVVMAWRTYHRVDEKFLQEIDETLKVYKQRRRSWKVACEECGDMTDLATAIDSLTEMIRKRNLQPKKEPAT